VKLTKALLISAAAIMISAPAFATDVKIGVLNDRSGVYADLSGEGSVVAAKMAIDDFDGAKKGINVTVVSADHQNKPDIASSIAREWYDQDGVDAIFDVPTSSAALAVSQVTKEKNKVFIDSGAGSTDLTGKSCSPNTIHWTYDTYALANGTARALVDQGKKSWFFITADYAFGQALERDTTNIVKSLGGTVVGDAKYPFPGSDFSSYLLQAQASKADVIGLANAGGDTVNTMKQAAEFGIAKGGQSLAALLVFITDVNAMGLQTAQGLLVTEAFYWDANDQTRAWSKHFAALHDGKMPTMVQAGVYASVLDYLKAVEATGGKDSTKVLDWMKANPTDDPLFGKGSIRSDGRVLHPMYLYQVKTPAESKGEWDYYKLIATIPADQAFRPLADGGCSLVK
jgi:branched-chain amino acid transport system substrate-binding protein